MIAKIRPTTPATLAAFCLLLLAIACNKAQKTAPATANDGSAAKADTSTVLANIIETWDFKAQDLFVFDTFADPNRRDIRFSGIDLNGDVYYWTPQTQPKLIAGQDWYQKNSLYMSKHGTKVFTWARTSYEIHAISVVDGNIVKIATPANLAVNHITYYWSPRLKKLLCLLQGTESGYSGVYYGEIDPTVSAVVDWKHWGKYQINRPIFVEGGSTMWVFSTYGYYNDWQYLQYCWCWTDALSWGRWHSMSYIGDDYHFAPNSLVGSTCRDHSGGYSIAFTNNEGAHNIIANGGNDAYPTVNSTVVSNAYYKQPISDSKACTLGNEIAFFYLVSDQLYAIISWPKEQLFSNKTIAVSKIISFAVLQELKVGLDSNYPVLYCDGTKTSIGNWQPTVRDGLGKK